jgi:hypothetical protein
MHILAYTVACQLAHYTVAMTGAMVLYSAAYIAYMSTGNGSLDAQIESLLGGLEQFLDFLAHLAYTESVAAVATIAVKLRSAVNGYDVAFLEHGRGIGDAMNHNVVDRCADAVREGRAIGIWEPLERWHRTMIADKLVGNGIKLKR